jgi:MFS family permease
MLPAPVTPSSPPPAPDSLLRRYPAFISFWWAGIASSFAFQMVSVAVGWQVYAITGRAFDLGLIGLAQFVPSMLLALPAGHAADQFERRRIVFWGQVAEALAMAMLTVLILRHDVHEVGILALVLAISVARAFAFPAMQSMLPALVPPALLPRAMAANASGSQVATIVGPALGGFLYVAGPGAVYGTAAVLGLVAATRVARLRYVQALPPREPATLRVVFAGVHFIARRPDVLGAISLDLFAVLLGGATALLPIFARDILHTGPWGLGLLRGAPAAGALLMSLWLAHRTLDNHVGLIMYGAVAGFGVATLVFAVSTTMWLSLAALLALGAFDMVSVVIRGALVQLDTPHDMRGRVSAVNAIFIDTSSQLGEFESGMLAAWLGAMHATLVGGIGTLLVVGLWMVMFPTLRRRRRLEGSADDDGTR